MPAGERLLERRLDCPLEHRLVALVEQSAPLLSALRAARELGLASWCIGAGVIRSLVWDHLHGFERATATADVDLVFHDPDDLGRDRERTIEQALACREPGLNWEAVNQAGVHLWLRSGEPARPVPPLRSLAEGVGSWPETATCVGVSLSASGEIEVVAPLGLRDLFDMTVRWNPARVSKAVYLERIATKRFDQRWPKVKILL